MTRVKRGVVHTQKRKKLLRTTKGYRYGRNRLLRAAKMAAVKAGMHAYRDRRLKKRTFRGLWIQRINAAARLCDTTYSKLICGLTKAGIEMDRKVLADVAARDMDAFKEIVKAAKV